MVSPRTLMYREDDSRFGKDDTCPTGVFDRKLDFAAFSSNTA